MKKLLSLLGAVSVTTTSTISLMACGGGNSNKVLDIQDENEKLQGENEKLQGENKELKDENQKLKWKVGKSILFIDSINPPRTVKAVKPDMVKESELVIALKPKVLEAVKLIDDSLTEDDFIIGFQDYFNHRQPYFIDLTTAKKITIVVRARNKTINDKKIDVLLPVASKH